LKLSPNLDPARLKAYLEPTPDSDLSLTLVRQVIPDSFVYLQLSIFALAMILIGVALVNVFNSSLLAMQERLKMIGILKTLGVTPDQVSMMVNTTAGFLGMLAVIVGIPSGLIFTKGVLTLLSRINGVGSVAISVNLFYILLLMPLMVGVSMIGSFIPSRQAAKVSIVRVLRHQ
jgi:putative ABC transport system permease protein